MSVSTPEDLALAFETFYSLIFSTAGNERVDSQFPDSGELSFDISVPSYGAEEVNIILDTSMMTSLELYSPEGQMDVNQVNEATMRSGDYDVIKLADPAPGMWRLDLCGVPENKVTINVIYNVDSSAVLTTTDGGSDYPAGGTVGVTAGTLPEWQLCRGYVCHRGIHCNAGADESGRWISAYRGDAAR